MSQSHCYHDKIFLLDLLTNSLDFLVEHLQLCNSGRQLHISSIVTTYCISAVQRCTACHFRGGLLGVVPFSYFNHSIVLWVVCAPPSFLLGTHCFASMLGFLGIHLLIITTFFFDEALPSPFCDSHHVLC